MIWRTIALSGLLLSAGCTEAFDPTLAGPRPFAVFAVLSTASDSQTVRLTATSDPTDAHPRIRPVTGAVVTIQGPEGMFLCQAVQRTVEPGSEDSVITEYVARSFRPVRGNSYTLRVQSPQGSAIAAVEVPAPYASPIYLRDFLIVQDPHSYPLSTFITVLATIAPQTLGLMMRFVLEYEVLRDGVWTVEQTEVPLAYVTGPAGGVPVYPRLSRRESIVPGGGRVAAPETAFFLNEVYEETIAALHSRIGSEALRMRRAVFYLHQADRHFFTYFSFANSFDDPLSIRVDQPDYSNVIGALGIFGATTTDSVSFPLSPTLGPRLD